jgi:hypothetical protein
MDPIGAIKHVLPAAGIRWTGHGLEVGLNEEWA